MANRAKTRREDGRWVKANSRANNLKRDYGLTPDAFDRMAAAGCWVCGSFARLCVDHDHATGLIRGILCDPCNVALGRVQDDPNRLHALAWYLEGHANSSPIRSGMMGSLPASATGHDA